MSFTFRINITLLTILSSLNIYSQVVESDSLALVDFYNALDGPNWTDNTNWLSNQPVSTWEGVIVSGDRVSTLDFRRKKLKGSIPSSFSNLTQLVEFDLSENEITGVPDLSPLTRMRNLNLGNNNISSFPLGFESMPDLINLSLFNNQINGEIPSSLSSLTKLQRVAFGDNPISGTLPDMTGWAQLGELYISNTELSGNLEDVLPSSSSMYNINAENCQLTGSIPSSAFTKESNVIIIFTNNEITDITPLKELNIKRLWARDNRLDFANLLPFLDNVEDFRYDTQKSILAPENRNVVPGSNITLVSDIDGEGTSYQWYKNDEIIEGATNAEWIITTADESDAGIYYCTGTHPEFPGLMLTQTPTNLTVDNSTSTSEVNLDVKLYPNPFKEKLIIEAAELIDIVTVYNMQGQRVFSVEPKSDQFLLDLSSLTDSRLILSIQGKSGIKSQIIIKQ